MDHHQPASRYQVQSVSITTEERQTQLTQVMRFMQNTQNLLKLHNEDDPPESTVEEPSTSTETAQNSQPAALSEADVSPPPYCSIAVEAAAASETPNEFYPVPPPYSVATSLPTYDEAEKAKAAAMAAAAAEAAQREEEYPPRDDFSDADQLRVGNDGIFMLAFFMAFIFNWIGFCLSFCITNTIAGRYGAICGFGLSLIKWILIVRFSDYFTGYFNGQYWLWWIFLVLGLLLFFRGFVNYLKVRNMSESMAAAHRTRFFFLY
ncbi:NEDD4 family-interacting protein 2 isoform X2 [Lepidochelys kempii]|uniref:NEDD4 family-interacting protein 2 isoform X2 n=1 Tax=Caretta caretta TaxID=8467 RepID=UPI002095A750|nr:NEDD4 family-interacting protein 2 isoform X2 [Caretta caretta]